MKKTVSLLLSVLMVLSLFPMAAVSVNAEETAPPEEMEFTEVYTVEDLYMINYALDGNYKLMNDIDLTADTAKDGDWDYIGNGWDPIGSGGAYKGGAFTGIFDGNGYEIKGMRIDINKLPSGASNNNNPHAGLFARNAGTIKNLTVSGEIKSSVYIRFIGAICGYNRGKIENCANKCNIDCSYSKPSDQFIGGISGYSESKSNINCCYNNGSIKGLGLSSGLSGGSSYTYFLYVAGISNGGHIKDCYNTGNISATNKSDSSRAFSSGICAIKFDSYINNCYSIGTATKAISYSSDNVSNCYFLAGCGGDTIGTKSLTAAQMKLQGVFGTFDFENIWFIDRNLEYQYPQLIHNRQIPNTETPTAIEITTKPEKLSYFTGEAFDSTGLVVSVVYENGDKEEVTRYTLSGYDSSTIGTKTITVTYGDLTATFDVEVEEKPPVLTSIAIIKQPDKMNYYVGDAFDSTGLAVYAVYDNGSSKEITDYTLSGYDSSTTGKKTITVSYDGFTAAFDVEVQEKPVNLTSVAIVKKPDKLSYFVGEAFDNTGMVVVALYDNNTTEAVNDYNFSGFDSSTTGKKTITVAYKGLTATFDVEIKEKPVNLTSITIVQKPDKLSYFIDEEFDSTGLIVNAVYDNGTSKAVTDYTLSGFDSSTVGKKTITVTYGDYTAGFEVEVKAQPVYLKSLTVIKQPDKTVYNIGEELDTKGMMVIGVYSDGAVVNISDYTVSKLTEDIGEQTVTVSYEGKIATFNVTVEDKKVLIGDVNNDGQVNGADAGVLSRYAAGWKGYADKIKNLKVADVNNDGSVNGADAGILARYTSGWKQYAKFFES